MKTLSTLILVTICVCGAQFVSGQASGNWKYREQQLYQQQSKTPITYVQKDQKSEIIFDVNALLNVKADCYVAIFNITQVGETSALTNELLNKRLNSFIDGLKQTKIDTGDIFVDMVSQVPVYEYEVEKKLFSKSYNEIPIGFELQKNVHIKYSDEKRLDEIVSIASQNEIYDLVKVDYFVENHQMYFDTLRTRAIELIKTKIKDYKKLGFNLDTLHRNVAENAKVNYPISQYKTYQAYSRPSFAALRKRLGNDNSKITEAAKSRTMYYSAIPYDNYDIVIHPTILEPAVQFSYSIVMKYSNDPPLKADKKYILITPDGKTKSINLK